MRSCVELEPEPPLGAGLVMKTINNSMIQVYFNGLQDMMRLSKRAGLEMEQTLRILLSGPAAMPMLLDRLPRILGEDTSAGFTINAGRKDAEVFARVIKSYGIPTDLMEIGGAKIQAVVDAGLGDEDPARLISYAYETG